MCMVCVCVCVYMETEACGGAVEERTSQKKTQECEESFPKLLEREKEGGEAERAGGGADRERERVVTICQLYRTTGKRERNKEKKQGGWMVEEGSEGRSAPQG